MAWLTLIAACLIGEPPALETRFIQVYPATTSAETLVKSEGQTRAVILIHGLRPHTFRTSRVAQADFQTWQAANSDLVRALGAAADVFAFAYGQNVCLEDICAAPHLLDAVRRVKKLDYAEVVLVGHSAGGLLARMFVEDHPDAGVTKVIQVCSPNGGASVARMTISVRHDQEAFLKSLTKEGRESCCRQRPGRKIPEHIQFVSVVGAGGVIGDGIVSCSCQWSSDLQDQCIPAIVLATTHFTAMSSTRVAALLARLVRDKHPRWEAAQIRALRVDLLRQGDGKSP
jgi:pimeloyl-ACP methyl ester carboxylesterase